MCDRWQRLHWIASSIGCPFAANNLLRHSLLMKWCLRRWSIADCVVRSLQSIIAINSNYNTRWLPSIAYCLALIANRCEISAKFPVSVYLVQNSMQIVFECLPDSDTDRHRHSVNVWLLSHSQQPLSRIECRQSIDKLLDCSARSRHLSFGSWRLIEMTEPYFIDSGSKCHLKGRSRLCHSVHTALGRGLWSLKFGQILLNHIVKNDIIVTHKNDRHP